MMTFLPVFAKDIFHQGPGMFTLFLSISGHRLDCGRADGARRWVMCITKGGLR